MAWNRWPRWRGMGGRDGVEWVAAMRGIRSIGIDVALGGMPFESNMIDRATPYDLGDGRALLTCSPEDLLVSKAFANRDRDWLDIKGVLIRQRGQLDLALVAKELRPLAELKGEMVVLEKLLKLAEESQ